MEGEVKMHGHAKSAIEKIFKKIFDEKYEPNDYPEQDWREKKFKGKRVKR
jgi:hypothetical protein